MPKGESFPAYLRHLRTANCIRTKLKLSTVHDIRALDMCDTYWPLQRRISRCSCDVIIISIAHQNSCKWTRAGRIAMDGNGNNRSKQERRDFLQGHAP